MGDESGKNVQLFDLTEKRYPNRPGTIFRSKQIAQCGVCGALTNRVLVGRVNGDVKMFCPHVLKEGHDVLAIEMKRLNESMSLNYPGAVSAKKMIGELRAFYAGGLVCNDLEGDVDLFDPRLRRWAATTI